jgi:hypothetical protein
MQGRTQDCEWYSGFRGAQPLVEDFKVSGCPSQSQTDGNVETVHEVSHDSRHHMINGVSNILG